MMKTLARTAALLVTAAVLATGCSGSDGEAAVSPSATTSVGGPAGVRTVAGSEALRLAQQGAVVLDVRTPEEYAEGHLDGARNLNLADGFEQAVASLPRNGRYVVYCRSGNRSAQAAALMRGLGFTDVADAGGLDSLARAGGAVVR